MTKNVCKHMKSRKLLMNLTVLRVLSLVMILMSILSVLSLNTLISAGRGRILVEYTGNDIYRIIVENPHNKNMTVMCMWSFNNMTHSLVIQSYSSVDTFVYSKNTTIEVVVMIFNESTLEEYYYVVYQQNYLEFLMKELSRNVFTIVSSVVIIILVFVIINIVKKQGVR